MILAAILGALMGLVMGLLGGGGSVLTVPMLVYILAVPDKEAIAASTLIVAITAIAGAVQHGRNGNILYRTGALFAVFAMGGAYGGGSLAKFFSGQTLLLLFALMMLVSGIAMLRPKKKPAPQDEAAQDEEESNANNVRELPIFKIALEGILVGVVTGLVGAGGGFLVVPALVLLGGVPMHLAIGTSLMVVALKSLAAFAGYAGHVDVNYPLALTIGVASILGSWGGARLAPMFSAQVLRKGFAGLIFVMAVFIIYTKF